MPTDGMSSDERQLRMVNPALASLLYDPESMTSFKKRVDDLLIKLNGSPAGPDKVAADPLSATQFGGGGGSWAEAAGIFDAYKTVIHQLKQLSQLLADCMEGMGIVVVSSKDGYQGMDDDIRQRMLAISQNTQEHYDPKRDPVAQEQAAQEKAQNKGEPNGTGKPGDTAGAGGLK
ncbi:hypothetical protein [Streptomyces sp. V4I23]|uniref:hypothetical protein n=1 Tax=Streptomyces sp. V4I23 TaxID=3042282 RepID=UPI0027D89148|nr:hypothetical protein [Streptomyces sp. V4I23]